MFLYISSSDSSEYFPGNKSAIFKVSLPKTIHFEEGPNLMALVDIKFPKFTTDQSPCELTINTSLCRESHTSQKTENTLQRIYSDVLEKEQQNAGSKNFIFQFNPVRYIPVNVRSADIIDLYIKRSDGEKLSLMPGTTECTLHFSRSHGL